LTPDVTPLPFDPYRVVVLQDLTPILVLYLVHFVDRTH